MQAKELFEEKTNEKFDNFYKKYHPKLVWYMMKFCKDETQSQDLADEAFLRSLNKIHQFNPERGKYSTWLFTIAKYLLFQKKGNEKKYESLEEDHEGATISDFLVSYDNNENYKNEVILQKKAEIIKREIPQLPEKYSKVLKMRELDNLPYQDIADHLDLNLSTVKSQIRQGRIMLIEKVNEEFQELENIGVWDI